MTDLETTLLAMTAYGQPRLSFMDDAWHCRISMHVSAKGASFEIKSDYTHATPSEAVNECLARIRAVAGDTAAAKAPIAGSLTHG